MNTAKRYLILDSNNLAVVPRNVGYSGPDLQSGGSPSFLKRAAAEQFGSWLAIRAPGNRFYLAVVEAAVVSYTKPDPDAPGFTATTEE